MAFKPFTRKPVDKLTPGDTPDPKVRPKGKQKVRTVCPYCGGKVLNGRCTKCHRAYPKR